MIQFALVENDGKYYILNYNRELVLEKKKLEMMLKNRPFKKTRIDALTEARQKKGYIFFTTSITPWR
jgi:hypothetical protein